MEYVADLHVHSRYSRATSRDATPENYYRWAVYKGVSLVGTGDCTHPAWREELRDGLAEAEGGLYRLKKEPEDLRRPPVAHWPGPVEPDGRPLVRFVVTGEVSTIYKKGGRVRKVHHLVLLPDLAAAERLGRSLGRYGNMEADGRPVLGLDSRDLLALVLETAPEALLVPAHVWTPHFSLFGANSGFDAAEECFEDLTAHVTALETGLSSDPPMNWRLSALDRFLLVSNSDAHSPRNLAREANLLDTPLTYPDLYLALRGASGGLVGTLEFFPEEGKYHYDGHRACRVRWRPAETLKNGGLCPVCGRRVTVGVLHRVEELADRAPGARPAGARPFESLVPLPEVIADALGVGPNSRQVLRTYFSLLQRLGPELFVLRSAPLEEVARLAGSLVAEALRRMRAGEIELLPGFDGEYGKIVLIRPEERSLFGEQTRFFAVTGPVPGEKESAGEVGPAGGRVRPVGMPARPEAPAPFSEPLNREQWAAVRATEGPVIVIAGPGTGKTRTLVYRIAHLVGERGVPPREITAVTFTNRAAEEVRRRAGEILAGAADPGDLTVGTFHGLCLDLLRRARSPERLTVLDEVDAREVLAEALREAGRPPREAARWQQVLSLYKSRGLGPEDPGVPPDLRPLYLAYLEKLASYRALDYDDLLLEAAALVEADPASGPVREFLCRCTHLLVDEFQDVNPVQYRLVRLWARRPENLFVIGDPDQAIYGFRGADHRLFRRLKEDFPQAKVCRLRVNYRSTPTILRAARALAADPGDLTAVREDGAQVVHLEAPGETAEGIAVAREISGLVGGTSMLTAGQDGGRWGFADIAVLFRTGRQAALLEECLLKEGIPYRVVGREGFLEERPVREVLNFLRCVADPEDDWHALLCLGGDRFRLGPRGLALVREEAGRRGGVWRAASALASSAALDPADREKLAAFVAEVEAYRRLAAAEPPERLLARVVEQGESGAAESMRRLLRLAARFGNLASFLRGLVLAQEADWERPGAGGPTPEAVSLMTLHAAKGLEFPVVFITGVEDGLLPLRDAEDPDEERRLFYVGLTRARDLLILTSARTRTLRGTRVRTGPSAFLRYLPPDCLQRKGWAGPGGKKKGGSEGRPGHEQLQLFEF